LKHPPDICADIVVVGAGLAGATAAAVLGRQGHRVILVDPRPSYPRVFKAEKLEPNQAELLRKFGLLEHILPYAGEVREIRVAYDGRIFKTFPIEQYGVIYSDMVNAIRARLPGNVEFWLGRAEATANRGEFQTLKLSDGQELAARVIVLASGVNNGFHGSLRLRRRVLRRDQSQAFGFTIAGCDTQPFDFDSVTYYSIDPSSCIDYLSLFKVRQTMRANLFVFRTPGDPWVRTFVQEPDRMLRQHLPKLERVIGKYQIVSKIEFGRADLYRLDGDPPPGVVLIGDSFQSVCPSTGTGIDKVLTDVDVLAECVPRWLETPGLGSDKLAAFYQHPRKLAIDARSLWSANHHWHAAMDRSVRWRIFRFLLHRKWRLQSAAEILRRMGR
jgi:2-polyprenyl-6-methoxyphenol hydroxylase-like FAD-dependent oxidoreductase